MTFPRRISILILSFLGIVDATYITQHALSGIPSACSINGYDGCSIVDKSIYSHLFGLPLSMYGFLFYASIFILTATTFVWTVSYVKRSIQILAGVGILASSVFIWLQAYLIKAFCIYCIFSAILTVLIALIVFWHKKTAMYSPTDNSPGSTGIGGVATNSGTAGIARVNK